MYITKGEIYKMNIPTKLLELTQALTKKFHNINLSSICFHAKEKAEESFFEVTDGKWKRCFKTLLNDIAF